MGLLLLLGALQACTGGIKLGYNNGVDLAAWWLDGHVDLNKPQSQQVRSDLRQLQAEHRQKMLPEYAQTLRQTQALVVNDLTAEQVCAVGTTIRGYADALLLVAEPAATTLAISLTPAQIGNLERKYVKTDADYRKDWLNLGPADMHEKRFDKALERAEMVYGRLDATQKTLLRQQVDQSSFEPQRVHAERLRRQTDIIKTLREIDRTSSSSADARATVAALLKRAVHSPDTAHRQYADALAHEDCRAIAAVHNSTSEKQRAAAVKWLGGYAQTFMELSAQH